jgi:hypothetical protein
MLGLASHEPHFSLLREEVKFGKQNGKVSPVLVLPSPSLLLMGSAIATSQCRAADVPPAEFVHVS